MHHRVKKQKTKTACLVKNPTPFPSLRKHMMVNIAVSSGCNTIWGRTTRSAGDDTLSCHGLDRVSDRSFCPGGLQTQIKKKKSHVVLSQKNIMTGNNIVESFKPQEKFWG